METNINPMYTCYIGLRLYPNCILGAKCGMRKEQLLADSMNSFHVIEPGGFYSEPDESMHLYLFNAR
jgi:hypothetical protein